jgi:squalene-hopene/tetraprenyl-beta-curcumene cyclase
MLLVHFLGETPDLALEAKIGAYLRRIQSPSAAAGGHDGWPLYQGGAFDVSATVKAYYALKMIGDDPQAPTWRARAAILKAGGAEAVNVFTRIQLALFGAADWADVPTIRPS